MTESHIERVHHLGRIVWVLLDRLLDFDREADPVGPDLPNEISKNKNLRVEMPFNELTDFVLVFPPAKSIMFSGFSANSFSS